MVKLQDEFRNQAGWVWHNRKIAESMSLPLNEETITETLILRLARRFEKGPIQVKAFSKREENKNGADWELIFKKGNRAIGLRLQAKRLNGGEYKGLPLSQATNLINHASKVGFHPYYLLYNDPVNFGRSSNARKCFHPKYKAPSYLGCTMVHAGIIRGILSKEKSCKASISPEDIRDDAFPWHCLLCGTTDNLDLNVLSRKLWRGWRDWERYDCEPKTFPEEPMRFPKELHALHEDNPYSQETLDNYLEGRDIAGVIIFEGMEE